MTTMVRGGRKSHNRPKQHHRRQRTSRTGAWTGGVLAAQTSRRGRRMPGLSAREWDYSSSHRAIDAGAQGECIPPRRLGSNLDADEIMEYGWVFERRNPPRTSNGNYLVRSPN